MIKNIPGKLVNCPFLMVVSITVIVFVVEFVMNEIKRLYNIPEERECRLWHKYMLSTYDLLNKLEETIQDAGLYTNQVCVCLCVCVAMCVCSRVCVCVLWAVHV